MTDPRTAAVEDSLDSFAEALARSPLLTRGEEPDVLTYYCEKPFPLLNVIAAARFAPGDVERRASEVAETFLERGLPFMWWSTPSGHADELRRILTGLGMHCEEVPGMYADLGGPVDLLAPDGAELRPVSRGELGPTVDVTLAGFGIPVEYAEDFRVALDRMLADGMVQITAWLDGEPVASGSAWITGETGRPVQHDDGRAGARPWDRVRRHRGPDERRTRARLHPRGPSRQRDGLPGLQPARVRDRLPGSAVRLDAAGVAGRDTPVRTDV
ncbi:MAG TPA: hypothetical protein VHR35_01615 [Nocardioides sp.]|jgi:hypothetical protein|nr:hypothetical protein [Nocardioides sp.]